MPIEIKELHIRINLEDKSTSNKNNQSPQDLKKSVRESMDKMVELLKKQKER